MNGIAIISKKECAVNAAHSFFYSVDTCTTFTKRKW